MGKNPKSVLEKPWARSWEDVAGALEVSPDEGLDPAEARRLWP